MDIIEYFTSEDREHWLNEIERSDWGAGKYLAELLRENRLQEMVGENALVFMLTDGDRLVSYCTYAMFDDIQPTELTPWVGFVYTFPEYRGNRYMGKLLHHIECIASTMGKEAVYISTGHTGLYEKYGYEFFRIEKDIEGEDSRVYRKDLSADGEEKEKRMAEGDICKAEIVRRARKGVDPVAVCGFSCNHCFLGQWCGGCRSVFNCCSFGTLYEKGKCPNIECAAERNLEGCYLCEELETCRKGFYQDGNDGAAAAKAQAMFVRKYGKELFLKVHDKLHEKYNFEKTQEILGQDMQKGLAILEETAKETEAE